MLFSESHQGEDVPMLGVVAFPGSRPCAVCERPCSHADLQSKRAVCSEACVLALLKMTIDRLMGMEQG